MSQFNVITGIAPMMDYRFDEKGKQTMKFIEITPLCGLKRIVNAGYIVSIDEHVTPDRTFTQVKFYDGTVLDCKDSYNQLSMLLDVDTIEKRIERLKEENFRRRMQNQYNEVFEKYIGGMRE